MLYTADTQHSEICITDGTFAWQTVQERNSLSDEPSSDSDAEVSSVIHCLDESHLICDDRQASDIQPTLMNINLTIPKVNFIFTFSPVFFCDNERLHLKLSYFLIELVLEYTLFSYC